MKQKLIGIMRSVTVDDTHYRFRCLGNGVMATVKCWNTIPPFHIPRTWLLLK